MRCLIIKLGLLTAVLLSACDFWPKTLEPLAESITRQVSGDTTAWLLDGDVLVINVAGSPLYQKAQAALEAAATDIAEQAIVFSTVPLESIAITFHEREVTADPESTREFIFLVMDNRPVLQPFDVDATGPLTHGEIQAAMDRLDNSFGQLEKPFTEGHRACVLAEMERSARVAGDPETLDLASMKYLSAETWNKLDAFNKRIILTQAIMTEAMFACASKRTSGLNPD